jgi:hypothetical protein
MVGRPAAGNLIKWAAWAFVAVVSVAVTVAAIHGQAEAGPARVRPGVPVYWTWENWTIFGTVAVAVTFVLVLLAARILRHGDTLFDAMHLRSITTNEANRKAIRSILDDALEGHDKNARAHWEQLAVQLEKARDLVERHNHEPYAHREALAPYATHKDLNGAVGRVVREIRYLRRDLHRMAPDKFEPDVENIDLDDTGGGNR